jgi:hypothetical protein
VSPASPGSQESGCKACPVNLVTKVILGFLGWLAVSVPVGILVGKALRASREAMEATERQESESKANRGSQGPRVLPDPPAWACPDRQARLARKASQVPQSWDHPAVKASQGFPGFPANPDPPDRQARRGHLPPN